MSNNQTTTSSVSHDVAVILMGVMAMTAVVATLSWTGIAAILIIRLVSWFFGSLTKTGIIAICVGVIAIIWAGNSGAASGYGMALYAILRSAAGPSETPMPLWVHWIHLSLQPSTWLTTASIGSIFGGGWLLLRRDYLNSPRVQVFGAALRNEPSPFARLRGRFCKFVAHSYTGAHILLGVDAMTGAAVKIGRDQLSRHFVVTGRSGRGKTVTVLRLVAECARLGIPIVYLDGKGDVEVRMALAKISKARGRVFHALDAGSPSRSSSYDAFSGKKPTQQKELVIQLREWSETHFKGLSAAYAQTAFKALQYGSVRQDLHTFGRSLEINNMLALAKRGSVRRQNYSQMRAEIIRRRKNEKKVQESLESVVENLTSSDFGDLLDLGKAIRENRRILNLRQLRKKAGIAYIGLPALQYPDGATGLASLVVSDLKATLVTSRKKILLVMDEFSFFANPTTTLNLINMGRSYGACVCLATQSWADFSAQGSEDFRRQVVGSVNTFITHELTGSEDAEIVAGLFSTAETVEYTAQIVDGERTDSASSRVVHQFKLHPAFIKRLATGEAYVLNKDKPDVVCRAKIIEPATE